MQPLLFKQSLYPGLGMVLFALCCVWGVNFLGGFTLPEGAVYDRLARYSLTPDDGKANILLVQTPVIKTIAGDKYWLDLLNTIQSFEPASVSITFFPNSVSRRFYEQAANYGNVIFGRQLLRDDQENKSFLIPLPAAAKELDLIWGVVSQPPTSLGVTRYQYAISRTENGTHRSLETTLADFISGRQNGYTSSYLINFINFHQPIPNVRAQRILDDGLIPEIINGKHVLIGLNEEAYLKSIRTPLSKEGEAISLLELQGRALNTLLTKKIPLTAPHWLTIALILVTIILSLYAYQRLTIKAAIWFSCILTAFYIAISWTVLSYLLIWLPIVMVITAQVIMLVLVFRYKVIREEQGLRNILSKSNAELQEKLVPGSFLDSTEHWAQVISLVNQTLDLNRVIFLERIPHDHRLREISALNCSLESIVEQRRDYERTPYSTAISTNGPIRLERAYLETLTEEADEDQYLVPLLFSGDVLGFWAFGIAPQKAASIPLFMQRVRDYGQQIAELLYHRQQWQLQKTQDKNTVSKYLQLDTGNDLFKAFNKTSQMLHKRLSSLEHVFDSMGTATILYDLFGNVIQVNTCMEKILQSRQIPIYDTTALDLMTTITALNQSQARNTLRNIMLERGTLSIPLENEYEDEQALILNIKPMEADQEEGASTLFQLIGFLFELVDISHYRKLYMLQETLVERLNIQIRNDMQSLMMATKILAQDHLASTQRDKALSIINEKVNSTVEVMKQSQDHLNIDLTSAPLERYPIDPKPIITTAISRIEEAAEERGITILSNINRAVGLVFSEPSALMDILIACFKVTLDDAAEDSELVLTIQQTDQHLELKIHNTGFGIPNERLQDYLSGAAEVTTEEFKKLRSAKSLVEKWEGQINFYSEVGQGMEITLVLRSFL